MHKSKKTHLIACYNEEESQLCDRFVSSVPALGPVERAYFNGVLDGISLSKRLGEERNRLSTTESVA